MNRASMGHDESRRRPMRVDKTNAAVLMSINSKHSA